MLKALTYTHRGALWNLGNGGVFHNFHTPYGDKLSTRFRGGVGYGRSMFSFRQDKPSATLLAQIGELQSRLSQIESAMRTLELEQVKLHQETRRWMRRAVAAEKRVEDSNQEPAPRGTATPSPPLPQTMLWGAAGRIAARVRGEPNGVRPSVQPADTPPTDGS